jgi:hypothetical protein
MVLSPARKLMIDSKLLYKVRHAADGGVEKYKTKFVARGISHKEAVDYDETFAPVTMYTSIITIVSLASTFDWPLYQIHVKTTVLNGLVEEEVYIDPLKDFEVHGRDTHVYRLKKALYGLKQGSRAWYLQIDEYL